MKINRLLFGLCGIAVLAVALILAEEAKPPVAVPGSAPAPALAPAQSPTEVVARVNGTAITRAQLEEMFRQSAGGATLDSVPVEARKKLENQTLDQLVGLQLMLEKSKSVKVEKLDEKVQERMESIKKQFPDEKIFAEQLKNENLSEAKLKEQMSEEMRMDALVEQEVSGKVQVTPNELKEFYDGHPEYFDQPAQVQASHILVLIPKDANDKVKAEKKALIDKARERVTQGEDFAKVAVEVSEDEGSKVSGGDLGFFGTGQMVKPFEDAAFALKTGEISPVVTTQFGYHIIKQTGSHPATKLPLESEKAKIEIYLKQQKTKKGTVAFVEALRKEAKIEILLK